MINWNSEKPLIDKACDVRALDSAFLYTIREVENGPSGAEFGVLSVSAPTYDDQLRIAVNTVAHRLASYPLNPLTRDAFGRIRYTENWIAHFASIWAPGGASNDPKDLNEHWTKNAIAIYPKHIGGSF